LRAEVHVFFCSLDVHYGGLGINIFYLIKKRFKKFELYLFPSVFVHQNSGSGLDPYPDPNALEMLDPDPQRHPLPAEVLSLHPTLNYTPGVQGEGFFQLYLRIH
jgi:hypothetical protein